MTWQDLDQEAATLEERARGLRTQAREGQLAELKAQPLFERLIFAAYSRCPCGAGLAYDPASDECHQGDGCWDCSAILLGVAVPKGEAEAVKHTAQMPFRFWSVKSERQPSVAGATTRPASNPQQGA